jgi:5-methylcytosine-specific restriction endonuclease McrA
MNKNERQFIFDKYKGKCAYCGVNLTKGWHADHIKPVVRDLKQTGTCKNPQNETLENYNPSCPSCNTQKNSFTLEQFRQNIKNFIDSLNKYNTQYKFAKRYSLLEETGKEVLFYFERVCK